MDAIASTYLIELLQRSEKSVFVKQLCKWWKTIHGESWANFELQKKVRTGP